MSFVHGESHIPDFDIKFTSDNLPNLSICGELKLKDKVTAFPHMTPEESVKQVLSDGIYDNSIGGIVKIDVVIEKGLKNSQGPELSIYETGPLSEPFNVTVYNNSSSAFSNYIKYYVGTEKSLGCTDKARSGHVIIDLSEFGIPLGDSVNIIRIDGLGTKEGCCKGADISEIKILPSLNR